jgi:hypothetical protein
MTSEDVIHSFFVPALRFKQDTVPGLAIKVHFTALEKGKYEIPCAELCGQLHSTMEGTLLVTSAEDYDAMAAMTEEKFKERMKEYLTAKHNLKIERTKNTLILNKTMTLCWIGLDLDIKDVGFLEHLRDDPIPRYPEVKDYAIKRLDQIDAGTGHSTESTVTEFPSSTAVSK